MPSESLPVAGDKQRAGPWWRELNRYHLFVFTVAALGWLFDTMDQQLFTLARKPAVQDLLAVSPGDSKVEEYSGYATSIFIMGWGVGGLIFGVVGDRYGRVRTMVLTILLYSLFTGLSALSRGFWDFAFYRFLTGLGVGGEFAVGVALVAEVMPDRARPFALGWLQACSAVGNITAALTSMLLGHFQVHNAWRLMFLVGVFPALLAIIIMRRLREPERWTALAKEDGVKQELGSLRELFGTPRWRRNTIVGMFLAFAGVVGLWGIGFFSPDLTRIVFRKTFESQGLSPEAVAGKLTLWAGITSLLLNGGAFFGIQAFIWLTHRTGRRPAFALGFIVAAASTAITFWYLKELEDIYWMMPLMGFCQLSVFGGYAIYFPELFPTRLRSTGTSFCYNVGRFAAAVGPSALGLLTHRVFADKVEPMRYAGVTMCSVFLLGLLVLPFAPETRGQPLPE